MASTPDGTTAATRRQRPALSRGLVTVLAALVLLFAVSVLFAPSSVTTGALQGMLPFAAVLAILAIGQTLVVMQGGFDLSVPGSVSLVVVIVTHQAYGNNAKVLPAALTALAVVLVAGLVNGILIGRLGLNAIVATLGVNALLYAGVLGVSGGTPRQTTDLLANLAGGNVVGVPNALVVAVLTVIITTLVVKRTVAGRRFEAVGANGRAAWATGLRVQRHRAGGYVAAQVHYWLGALLLAGILNKPTAYQGDRYLLPTVAAVVLGGTSLLGGRGNIVATALAALFLTQLDQFVLAIGVNYAVETLVQSIAFAVGVALYSIDWGRVRAKFRRTPRTAVSPT
ncbi:ABC transporter permease [Phycicoccus sp. SLBN-51]|uniref:ABC transporter permease n=1 Tax=Phycicoccus sp. SLBN-51 TaxID=2768447 RepID=UPI0011534484|nr:ABC transporter permease [Phycicoccus sp. SLBN-51]TQJ50518.1 ribose transport system permease protein [Phycicoccus sp. SLBN-51]